MTDKDPTPDRRVYFKNNATGDRGYMVKRHGADHMKYDRAGVDQTIPFKPEAWTQEQRTDRRFNAHEVAQVAYAADRRLALSMGLQGPSRLEWISLPETERIRWLKEGPRVKADHIRQRLWRAVVGVLADG